MFMDEGRGMCVIINIVSVQCENKTDFIQSSISMFTKISVPKEGEKKFDRMYNTRVE